MVLVVASDGRFEQLQRFGTFNDAQSIGPCNV